MLCLRILKDAFMKGGLEAADTHGPSYKTAGINVMKVMFKNIDRDELQKSLRQEHEVRNPYHPSVPL